jgi:hypothetical protein
MTATASVNGNGKHWTDEDLRVAELAIMDDPHPPRPDVADVERVYDAGLASRDFVNSQPCRGGPCNDVNLCDRCRFARKYLLVRIQRLEHGTPQHASDRAGYKDPEPQTAARIILDYFRERFRPQFKRGAIVCCADGTELAMTSACIPDTQILQRLAGAVDAPADKNGVQTDKLPGFFRKWAPVAWGDLLGELPDEVTAKLGDDAPAREAFVRLVREALCTQLTLGTVIRGQSGDNEVTQTERRSLIGWCAKLAKQGPWRDVRSLACWIRTRVLADGEVLLFVAIRHELFAQIGADRRLREMGPKAFARLAAKYGIGSSTDNDRPHGRRAIVLDQELVADLTAALPNDEEDEQPAAQ